MTLGKYIKTYTYDSFKSKYVNIYTYDSFKNKIAILPAKWVYLGIAEELQCGTSKLWHAIGDLEETKRMSAFFRF